MVFTLFDVCGLLSREKRRFEHIYLECCLYNDLMIWNLQPQIDFTMFIFAAKFSVILFIFLCNLWIVWPQIDLTMFNFAA